MASIIYISILAPSLLCPFLGFKNNQFPCFYCLVDQPLCIAMPCPIFLSYHQLSILLRYKIKQQWNKCPDNLFQWWIYSRIPCSCITILLQNHEK
ncbi:hypothetical protein BX070DRAFT_217997 [Coemansia spiralis]|nr:hypothetical protein BX070DRAFT_217997 [Coemansia spiralis]